MSSWVLVVVTAYVAFNIAYESGSELESRGARLSTIAIALLSTALVAGYEAYIQKRHRGWPRQAATFLSAIAFGLVGLALGNQILGMPWPSSLFSKLQGAVHLNRWSVVFLAIVAGSSVHMGAWNSPAYWSKTVYIALRILMAVSVTALGALICLELVHADLRAAYPEYPTGYCAAIVIGVAIGSALDSLLGIWTGRPNPGLQSFLETLIASAVMATIGLILARIAWIYLLSDILAQAEVKLTTVNRLYQWNVLGWAIVGAAYGSSKQAQSSLTVVFRLAIRLILIIAVLGAVATGGYLGYSVGKRNLAGVEDEYLIGLAIAGMVLTSIIIGVLGKFLKDLVKS